MSKGLIRRENPALKKCGKSKNPGNGTETAKEDNMTTVEKAHELAKKAHAGQVDKAGKDYITHPEKVSTLVEGEDEKCVALLHDVLEDTDVQEETIRSEFGDTIADAVVAMTRNKGESYEDFIKRAKLNPIARKVKIADLTHNMDLRRIPNVTEKDIQRVEKYKRALKVLQD